jgi:hypothetical protein
MKFFVCLKSLLTFGLLACSWQNDIVIHRLAGNLLGTMRIVFRR